LKTFRFAVAFAIFSAVAGHAQDSSSAVSLTANPVYQQNCAKCHGKTAEGRHFGGPSLVSEKTTAATAADLRAMISNGKGRMPKYSSKLTPEEIDKLVEQIQASAKDK